MALKIETTAPELRRMLIDVERRRGRFASAVAQLKKLLWIRFDADVQLELAWLLATAPEDAARDGKQALELVRALTERGFTDARVLDALAAAQAELRRFKAAVE